MRVCVTAQHRQMLDQVLDLFEIKPDHDLDLMQPQPERSTRLTARGAHRHRNRCSTRSRPTACWCTATRRRRWPRRSPAFYQQASPVGHVEAGLRTGNLCCALARGDEPPRRRRWPRVTISRRPRGRAHNLLAEGVPPARHPRHRQHGHRRAAARRVRRHPRDPRTRAAEFERQLLLPRSGAGRIVLVTGHRRENFGGGFEEHLRRARATSSERTDVQIVYPVHLNPNVQEPVERLLGGAAVHPPDRPARLPALRLADGALASDRHRLRRRPGRGAVARQAGAGHARHHRAARGGRGRHGRPGRHRRATGSSSEPSAAARRRRPLRAHGARHNPYGDGHAAAAHRAVLEEQPGSHGDEFVRRLRRRPRLYRPADRGGLRRSRGVEVIGVDVKRRTSSRRSTGARSTSSSPISKRSCARVVEQGKLRAATTPRSRPTPSSSPCRRRSRSGHKPDLSLCRGGRRARSRRCSRRAISSSSNRPRRSARPSRLVALDGRAPARSHLPAATAARRSRRPHRPLPRARAARPHPRASWSTTTASSAASRRACAAARPGTLPDLRQGRVPSSPTRAPPSSCKLTENAFRDVNIAFANELSIICDELGINVWELIRLANHHPRVNILQPGPGVGGHCIAVDPWFIVEAAPGRGAADPHRARGQRRQADASCSTGSRLQCRRSQACGGRPTVALLGLAFKPDVDDLRESPALADRRDGRRLEKLRCARVGTEYSRPARLRSPVATTSACRIDDP